MRIRLFVSAKIKKRKRRRDDVVDVPDELGKAMVLGNKAECLDTPQARAAVLTHPPQAAVLPDPEKYELVSPTADQQDEDSGKRRSGPKRKRRKADNA